MDCNVVQTFCRQSRIEIGTARAHGGKLVKFVMRDISIRSDKTHLLCNSPVSVRSTMWKIHRYSVGGVILHGSFELDRKQLMIKRCGRRKSVMCKICGLQRCTDAPPTIKNREKDCRRKWLHVGKSKGQCQFDPLCESLTNIFVQPGNRKTLN